MWRKILLAVLCVSIPAAAMAHLCNDVFVQAKDNLAVKVDVRDGQLRIGQQGSFRVYLLNTMDRAIAKIALEVRTGGNFTAQVKPSPDWKGFPVLKHVKGGGRKEYFEVTLTRKPGLPDGTYKIDLHLFNPKNPAQVFKTVDLGDAAGICEVPKAAAVKVDGSPTPAEWGKSLSCTNFCEYRKEGKYFVRVPGRDQTVCRLSADKDNLYACFSFQGGAGAKSDMARLYVTPTLDSEPVKVTVDRVTGEATCDKGLTGVECKVSADKSVVELKVPRALLGVAGVKGFYANMARQVKTGGDGQQTLITYWRGNSQSVNNPVEYAYFKVAE
jgi:hypothetical protein